MIAMFVISCIIVLAVTFTTLDYIVRGCSSIRIKAVRNFMFEVCCSIPFTVLVNILVSYFLLSFTGAGAIAGMANLGSSVVVGIFGPAYMRRRFATINDPDSKMLASRVFSWMNKEMTSLRVWWNTRHIR